jgi:hypothetical protein
MSLTCKAHRKAQARIIECIIVLFFLILSLGLAIQAQHYARPVKFKPDIAIGYEVLSQMDDGQLSYLLSNGEYEQFILSLKARLRNPIKVEVYDDTLSLVYSYIDPDFDEKHSVMIRYESLLNQTLHVRLWLSK